MSITNAASVLKRGHFTDLDKMIKDQIKKDMADKKKADADKKKDDDKTDDKTDDKKDVKKHKLTEREKVILDHQTRLIGCF